MKERRLFDYFNEKFESYLPSTGSQHEAYTAATNNVWNNLHFTPYSSFESFIRLRKANKRKKITRNITPIV